MKHLWLAIAIILLGLHQVLGLEGQNHNQSDAVDLLNWEPYLTPTLSLNGTWNFIPDHIVYPDQLEHFQDSSLVTQVPGSWNALFNPSSPFLIGHGTGTYWLNLKGQPSNIAPNLHLDRVCSSARIFFYPTATPAQTPLATIGYPANNATDSIPSAVDKTVPLNFATSGTHTLLIQVANFSARSGGLCGNIELGSADAIGKSLINKVSMQSFIMAMALSIALYSLALYLRNRTHDDSFWLSVACAGIGVVFLIYGGFIERLADSDQRWVYELRATLLMLTIHWISISVFMIYARSFQEYIHRSWLSYNILAAATTSIFFILSPAWMKSLMMPIFALFWAAQYLATSYILTRAVFDRRSNAVLMAVGFAPVLLIAPIDIYQSTVAMASPTYGAYALLFFILVESQLLATKYTNALKISERLSNHFKEEVEKQTAVLHQQNYNLEQAQKALKNANAELKKLSITDGLTGLHNRMYFEQELRKEWRRGSRKKSPISVLMLDVDHFKRINDSAGHAVGDLCLQALANQLKQQIKRAGELIARYGGEEFVVLLPDTDQRKALAISESLRLAIEKMSFMHNGLHYQISVSIGISTTTPNGQFSPDQLLQAADNALYQAKHQGRNRVALAPLLSNALAQEEEPKAQSRQLP